MSGVEAAGFVLAAIPLIISALEHYRETAEVLEGWWRIKTEYKKCMRNLEYHRLVFEENLEEFLLPLIASEAKLQSLLDNPGGLEWEDPQLEAALQDRMPKTYSVYLNTIEILGKTIEELDKALGINKIHFQDRISDKSKSKVPKSLVSHVTSSLGYHGQVIKIVFSKAVLNQLFEEFGTLNTRLREILGTSDRLAPLRQSRKTFTSTPAQKFWHHANSVFKLLTDAWSCRCQSSHHATLLLQHRKMTTIDFRVVFRFMASLGMHSQPFPWLWQETDISLLDSSPTYAEIKLQVPSIIHHSASSVITSSQRPNSQSSSLRANPQIGFSTKAGKRSSRISFVKKLRWNVFEDTGNDENAPMVPTVPLPIPSPTKVVMVNSSSTTATSSVVSTNGSSTVLNNTSVVSTPISNETDKSITDLCSKIASCSNISSYGCLKAGTLEYIVKPICKSSTKPQEHISLQDLLGKSKLLTRRQRYNIALVLASSFVQLHPTPWLHSSWAKKDILFLYDVNDNSEICIEKPYISRPLSRTNSSTASLAQDEMGFQEGIRSLGIMLLELCFNKAIEDHELCASISPTDQKIMQVLLYGIASDWARQVADETGHGYSDAVQWCLHYRPERMAGDGKDESWRDDMIAKVIEPLKTCHDQLSTV